MNRMKWAVAEAIGVFLLCFVGGGSIIIQNLINPAGGDLLAIALAHGLALSVAITATMNISGGHINPAVTIGLLAIGRETVANAIPKIAGQLVGGILAGFCLVSLFPAEPIAETLNGTPGLREGVSPISGVALEIIGTAFLAFAVYGTAAGSKIGAKIGGFGIGLTLAFVILAIGPLTGAALNPARHLGTALAVGGFQNLWIYWVGPIVGAVIGMVLARFCLED